MWMMHHGMHGKKGGHMHMKENGKKQWNSPAKDYILTPEQLEQAYQQAAIASNTQTTNQMKWPMMNMNMNKMDGSMNMNMDGSMKMMMMAYHSGGVMENYYGVDPYYGATASTTANNKNDGGVVSSEPTEEELVASRNSGGGGRRGLRGEQRH
uniref:Uncharacterized protein n=1 Tax=Entomoneis paludosa TaxID=265537 RepID=A0A7S2Y571_9STRA